MILSHQPKTLPTVNLGHPLLKQCLHIWLPLSSNDGSGTTTNIHRGAIYSFAGLNASLAGFTNNWNQSFLAAFSTSNPASLTVNGMRGYTCSATQADAHYVREEAPNDSYSIFALFTFVSNPSVTTGNESRIRVYTDGESELMSLQTYNDPGPSANIHFRGVNVSSTTLLTPGITAVPGTLYNMVGTFSDKSGTATIKMYNNGLLAGSDSGGATVFFNASSITKSGRQHTAISDTRSEISMHTYIIWNRELTDVEVYSLYRNPWQIYMAPRRPLYASIPIVPSNVDGKFFMFMR